MAIVVPAAARTRRSARVFDRLPSSTSLRFPPVEAHMLRAEIPPASELLHTALINGHHSRVQQARCVNGGT